MLYMLNNEELIDTFVAEIVGTIMGDDGFTKENCVRIKNAILLRMDIEND